MKTPVRLPSPRSHQPVNNYRWMTVPELIEIMEGTETSVNCWVIVDCFMYEAMASTRCWDIENKKPAKITIFKPMYYSWNLSEIDLVFPAFTPEMPPELSGKLKHGDEYQELKYKQHVECLKRFKERQ